MTEHTHTHTHTHTKKILGNFATAIKTLKRKKLKGNPQATYK